MKTTRLFACRLVVGTLYATTTHLHAQHYPVGSEGIKAGSMPSPGFYAEDQNLFYFYNKVPGFGGQLQKGFEQFSYTQTPRLIWMTPWKVLDADFGMAARIPFAYQEYTHNAPFPPPAGSLRKVTEAQFGLSDIQIEPLILSWHLKRFDIVSGYSFWAPTGDYPGGEFNQNTGNVFYTLGKGYWTHMFTLGATWYLDDERAWTVSLLNHYEINMAQYSGLYNEPGGVESLGTTLGNIYTLEWAVAKTVAEGVNIGISGYYQQQVTDTQGPTPNGPTYQNEKVHVAGIGPEIDANCPKWGLSGALRYDYEFSAMDHPQGHLITLTITKSF